MTTQLNIGEITNKGFLVVSDTSAKHVEIKCPICKKMSVRPRKKVIIDSIACDFCGHGAGKNRPKPITDHLGNKYASISEMARQYDLKPKSVIVKMHKGQNLERILTKKTETTVERKTKDTNKPDKKGYTRKCLDFGFKTKNDMLQCFGISKSTFHRKLRNGESEESIIAKAIIGQKINEYTIIALAYTHRITNAQYYFVSKNNIPLSIPITLDEMRG